MSDSPKARRHTVLLVAGAIIVLVVTGILIPFFYLPRIRFKSEIIIARVDPVYLEIEGLYTFTNPLPWNHTVALTYPIPDTDGLAHADSIQAHVIPGPAEPARPLTLRGKDPAQPVIMLPLRKGVETRMRVIYRQKHNNAKGRYILTTTRSWKKPLEKAEFRLILQGVTLKNSNYPVEPVKNTNGAWQFSRTDFMPSRDWVFEFELKNRK